MARRFFFFFFVGLGSKLEEGYERESDWSSKGGKQNKGTRRKKEEEWDKKLGVGDLVGRHLEGGYPENEKRKGRTRRSIILKEDDSSIISKGC